MAQSVELDKLGRQARALYKELIKYSLRHPNKTKSIKYTNQIRKEFRQYRNIQDTFKIDDLFTKAKSRLGFLRMQVPSSSLPIRDRMIKDNVKRNRTTTYKVDESGEIAQSVSNVIRNARFSTWRDGNLDPDDKIKNDSLLERFHFRGPYWEKRRKGWLPDEILEMWDGPSWVEVKQHREKYDVGFDFPTANLEDHPDVKDHFPEMATRKDFGLDEPDVIPCHVPQKSVPDKTAIDEAQKHQYLLELEDKHNGMPTPTEFLRGRRER